MCSILGVSFAEDSRINRRKLATALLSAGEIRGRDASGFAWVSPDGDGIYKKDLPGSKLHVGRIPVDTTAMILHTRQSTHGDPRDMENNHPVLSPSGNLRLIHNGVVYNHREIRDLLGKVGKSLPEVDSSVIPAIIEEYGLDATSELGGYASAAWFDRETSDTIHLARFKTSTVYIAPLWDGSFAFASTADILAKALTRCGIAWYGSYPQPFESLGEGEYLQIMGGEVVTESRVEWKHSYVNRGTSYYTQTQGTTSASSNVTHIGTAKNGSPNSEFKGFGDSKASEDKSKDLVVVDHSPGADEEDEFGDEEELFDKDGFYIGPVPHDKRDANIMSMVFSNMADEEGTISREEYENWRRTGSITGEPSDEAEDEFDEEKQMDDTDINNFIAANSMYYTLGHDGDYMTYTSAESLIAALKWNAQMRPGENALVGPEEGNLRWVNQFADIGAVTSDEKTEFSWVKSEEEFLVFEFLFPSWVREGIMKLRNLVGA
jgi:Glucosamine 6-phosphate synthetase, contains amidotransferase and phosphosugar isomerase domains